MDKMTKTERLKAALAGQEVDRVPISIWQHFSTVDQDPLSLAETQVKTARKFDYDFIKLMQSPVRTVCTGTAASMGSILFLAGEKREMLLHTKIMIHDPSCSASIAGVKPLEVQKKVDALMEKKSKEIMTV